MNCVLCKGTINGKYWTKNDKEYCPTCYESIRLKCSKCRDNINGEYFTKDEQVYCPYCYDSIRLKCDICHNNIGEKYYISFGNNICKKCDNTHANCDVCNRYISHLTDGGWTYSDKRKICNICHKSVVKKENLNKYFTQVSEFMLSIGFKIDNYDSFDMREVTTNELDDSRGRCEYSGKTLNGVYVEKNFIIKILYGLPEVAFSGILAHELFHMWVKINTDDNLTKYQEEGIANLCQYLYLSQVNQNTEDKNEMSLASYLIKNMLNNKDKNYGDGFRKAKSIYENTGIDGVLQYIC